MRVIGYVRVSTDAQAQKGFGLASQKTAIEAECNSRGWSLIGIAGDEGISGSHMKRPGLNAVLEKLKNKEADVLMANEVSRISRSVADFARLIDIAGKQGWQVVTLDAKVDTSQPEGRVLVGVLSLFAQYEREIKSKRIREGLGAKKSRGEKLGRKPEIKRQIEKRIIELRLKGLGSKNICKVLNNENVPTVNGLPWHRGTVERILYRHKLGERLFVEEG